MCGIAGAVSDAPVDPSVVEAMCDRLRHRGPDADGTWTSDDRRVCLGHRRLAIVDLSPDANQPFVSADGRFVLTLNGEIYNFRPLRARLEGMGARFRTSSDTEVLLEAYRHWGADCLQELSGMFAFAIWDEAERHLFCARDRVGEKPFHYAQVGGAFVFASELKALLAWPGFRHDIDNSAVADFLSLGFVPDPKTIWAGARKLPPGHWLVVEHGIDGRAVVKSPVAWWDLEFDPDHSVSDWHPAVLGALEDAAAEMSYADVPLGAFLSGGVDSSSVTAALSRAGRSVHTFTVGFDDAAYDERPWAAEVARRYRTDHTERIVVATDVAPVFDEVILWHFDEPFNDYSYLPTYYLCREAKASITVALSGDGGDELFAGYRKYRRLALRKDLDRVVPRPLVRLAARAATALDGADTSPARRLASYGGDPSGMLADMVTTGLPGASLRAAARGALAETLRQYDPRDTVSELLAAAPPAEVGLVNAMRYLDLKLTLAGGILVKVDRASMAVALEARPVYLNRALIDLAARIPPSCLVDRHSSKKLLTGALAAWLPDSVLRRPKQGFAMPPGSWLAGGHEGDVPGTGPGRYDRVSDLLDTAALPETPAVAHSIMFLDRWLGRWAS